MYFFQYKIKLKLSNYLLILHYKYDICSIFIIFIKIIKFKLLLLFQIFMKYGLCKIFSEKIVK
jgi:hypothetical protein